ncbi:putative Glyceraldehyde 3-phosphate phosphatase [Vibrio chagasii]|nr:putative Glyceraldehyde 3-phosphate phosphatase [Vibrio chagasii]
MIKAVLLDMDETLCNTYDITSVAALNAFKAAFKETNVKAALMADMFTRELYNPSINRAGLSEFKHRDNLLCHLLLTHDVSIDEDARINLQREFDYERCRLLKLVDGATDVIEHIKSKGIKIGIITNGCPFSQYPKIKALNLNNVVDFIIISGDEPSAKPTKEIFLKGAQLADCDPSECIMVGDSMSSDIDGGLRAGMITALIPTKNKPHRPSKGNSSCGVEPTYTLESINCLKKIIN